ncbi:hypothetical protein HYALB_00003690 [Hymenoscyphus albidus]|uniref:Sm domain-containing protein n=1 Tax=Hymenoscyphus albidus TaxID=595503 RepID=A0A9N9LJX8_9HELO|nr:hypothetical protein HYALB_00003690 [Hymenoscyphus albidus]
MTSTIGIPIKLLNEAQGHVVTLEITSGQVYRGKLLEAEDNMNVQLKDITVTARDGRVSHLDQVYIRGSHVRFFIVPDMLRNAPMFKSRGVKGRGVGLARGRATVSRARASELTQTTPTIPPSGLAGSTHTYPLTTPYYSTTLPIWVDETPSPPTWSRDFLSPAAKEVLHALGAIIVTFKKPLSTADLDGIKELLTHVGEVVKEGCGYDWDGVVLAVACKQSQTPILELEKGEWEDLCQELGFEFVDLDNDWMGEGGEVEDFLLGDEGEEMGELGFGIDPQEMDEEMRGMKMAIYGRGDENGNEEDEGKDDEDVEKLQAMMLKMQAVRDMGADLPEAERKRLAAKTTSESPPLIKIP